MFRIARFLAAVSFFLPTVVISARAAAPKAAPVELDDRPEPFVPLKPTTQEDRYRQMALSHYSAGLMYEQDGNKDEALRQYQRALRYDPAAAAVLQRVVEVAWSLERHQEAIRYALKAAEVAPSNPELLERLAAFLVQENDVKRAVELYEKAIELQQGKETTAGYVRLKMLVGRLYAQLDDFGRAADAFEPVLKAFADPEKYGLRGRLKSALEGEKGNGYRIMGESFLRAERFASAEAAFEKAFKASGDEALYAFNQAQLAEKRKRYDEALEHLDKYFEAESDTAATSPYELLKELLGSVGRGGDFLPKLEKLLKDDPKNIPLRYSLANEYRDQKKYELAKPLYDDLLRRAATIEAYRGLLTAAMHTSDVRRIVEVLAEITAKTGDHEAVKSFIDEFIADGKRLDALVEAARTLAQEGQPDDGKPVAFAAAQVLLKAKRHESAREFYELALLHDPKATGPIFLSWGLGLLGDEKNESAIDVFRRAIEADASPEQPVFEIYLALALEFSGKTDEALRVMRKAAAATDGELRFEIRLPWILYHAKRYAEAAEAYEALFSKYDAEKKSDQDRKLLREARLSYSNVCVMLGELDRAEKPLEAVLDEFPDDVGAMNDLGYLWADRGKNLELALEMIRKAVASAPENRAYRDSLGWVYYRLGKLSEAVVELEKAIEPEPDAEPGTEPDGVVLDHLGDAYAAVGRKAEAVKAWKRAEKGFEKVKDAEKLAAVRKKLAK